MANYLASIFGTEQDKVRETPIRCPQALKLTPSAGQLLLLLQNRRLPPWRSLFTKTCQALLLANHPSPEPIPEPRLRPKKQDEP